MNKKELEQRLKNEGISNYDYCLEGGLPNEAYTLGENGDIWEVYYSERGKKSSLRRFNTEEEACDYFYTWLLKALRRN